MNEDLPEAFFCLWKKFSAGLDVKIGKHGEDKVHGFQVYPVFPDPDQNSSEFWEAMKSYCWFCTRKAFCHLDEQVMKRRYGDPDVRIELPLEIHRFGDPNGGASEYKFVCHEDETFDIFRSLEMELIELKAQTRVVLRLGTPEWPDDVVLWRLEDEVAFFPNVSLQSYESEAVGGYPLTQLFKAWADLQEFVGDRITDRQRFKILTPEQGFTRLGVFRNHLGPSYGLGGYGSTSSADLMQLREELYQKWLLQMFPHLFNVVATPVAVEEVAGGVTKEENPLERAECVVCDLGSGGYVCSLCKGHPFIKIKKCGCVRNTTVAFWAYMCDQDKCVICAGGTQGSVCEYCSENEDLEFYSCGCIWNHDQDGFVWVCPTCNS